jgi:hypothetical protein
VEVDLSRLLNHPLVKTAVCREFDFGNACGIGVELCDGTRHAVRAPSCNHERAIAVLIEWLKEREIAADG